MPDETKGADAGAEQLSAARREADEARAALAAANAKAEEDREAALAAERSRVAEIDEAVTAFAAAGVAVEVAEKKQWIDQGVAADRVRVELQGRLAQATPAPRPQRMAAQARDDRFDGERRGLMSRALMVSMGRERMSDDLREFRGMTFSALARMALEMQGRTAPFDRRELVREAFNHARGDFPLILMDTAHKLLRSGYEAVPVTFEAWSAPKMVTDLRNHYEMRAGDMPDVLPIAEDGVIPMGTFGEESSSFIVKKYGRRLAFTEELFINDDLGAFQSINTRMGQRVRQFEDKLAYATLAAPGTVGGTAFFHASRNNLAGTGAAVAEAALWDGVGAMRTQTGIGDPAAGDEPDIIGIDPQILLVGHRQEINARKVNGELYPTTEAEVQTLRNRFTVVSAPRLDAADGVAEPWYLFAAPGMYPAFRSVRLMGYETFRVESKDEFETTGMQMRVIHYFNFQPDDPRAAYKNPGIV